MNIFRHDKDAPPVIMHPPYAILIAIAIAWLLSLLMPIPGPRLTILFLPFTGVGLILILWAAAVMHRAKTGIPTYQTTTEIVDGGPFAITRNPIYVGLILIMLGLACLRGTAWYWAALLALLPYFHFGVVLREEAYLVEKFGQTYLTYLSRVKRWGIF